MTMRDFGMTGDAYQATLNLNRVIQAASRWSQDIAYRGRLEDSNDEYAHIVANLDHVRQMLVTERGSSGSANG